MPLFLLVLFVPMYSVTTTGVNCFDVVSAYVLKMNWHFFKQETEISRII
jgi:hypothetical protein